MALIYGDAVSLPTNSFSTPSTSSSFSFSGQNAYGFTQLLGVLASSYGSKVQAGIQKQNLKFSAQMYDLNAGYTEQTSLLSADYAKRMGAINANAIKYTASVNARIAELGAQSVLAQAEKEAVNLTLKAGALKSTQKAAMAANGIDLGVGSAAEVIASTEIMKESDMQTIKENSVRSAWGYRTQGASATAEGITQSTNALIGANTEALNVTIQGAAQARSLRNQASANYSASNSISPSAAATSTLIGGAASVAESWYKYKRVS
jgi:hypothetical protein